MATSTSTTDQDAAKCGMLKYVSVDWEEWHFQSSEAPAVFHTVHLADYDCSGACSCPNFDMRIRPRLNAGLFRPHEPRAKCKHIRRADRILCYKTKKALFARTNPNPK